MKFELGAALLFRALFGRSRLLLLLSRGVVLVLLLFILFLD